MCLEREPALRKKKPLGFDVSTLVRVSFSKAAELLRWEIVKFRRFFSKTKFSSSSVISDPSVDFNRSLAVVWLLSG